MISIEQRKREGYEMIYLTTKEVKKIRQDLENKTREDFEYFARARRETWAMARYKVLG